jgi:hypothetical protein
MVISGVASRRTISQFDPIQRNGGEWKPWVTRDWQTNDYLATSLISPIRFPSESRKKTIHKS